MRAFRSHPSTSRTIGRKKPSSPRIRRNVRYDTSSARSSCGSNSIMVVIVPPKGADASTTTMRAVSSVVLHHGPSDPCGIEVLQPAASTMPAADFRLATGSEADLEPELHHPRLIGDVAVERWLPEQSVA